MKRLPIVIATFLVLISTSDLKAQSAVAQFIHGSADPSLSVVDIHVDNLPFIQNFAFRQATSYLDIPTEVDFTIDITLPGGDPTTESLYHFEGFSNPGLIFTIFLRGVADTTLFSPNPEVGENRSTALQFRINPTARPTPPGNPQLAWFNFYNGVTDSAPFDLWASADSTILSTIGALHYSAFTGYVSADRGPVVFDRVDPALSLDQVLDSYLFDFSSLPNTTATIFATGFVDPDNNQNGESVTFHAALADGTVLSAAIVTDSENDFPIRSNDVGVYPNPASTEVYFDLENLDPNSTIELFDPLGRRLWSRPAVESKSISVENLPAGLYHALISSSGKIQHSSFFVRR